jgi:phosphoribosylglycinamide formyltransferase-1
LLVDKSFPAEDYLFNSNFYQTKPNQTKPQPKKICEICENLRETKNQPPKNPREKEFCESIYQNKLIFTPMNTKRIAIFASGSGSNAIKLIEHFDKSPEINAVLLLTNNENAGVLEKTEEFIDQVVINNDGANDGSFLAELMQEERIDYIILAGYLRKIPSELIKAYPTQIINIHPALLPKYGGKGMYGMKVHQAVLDNKETESGITIHLVNDIYDEGKILAQYKVELSPKDDADAIQKKVLAVEHKHFSEEVEKYIQEQG